MICDCGEYWDEETDNESQPCCPFCGDFGVDYNENCDGDCDVFSNDTNIYTYSSKEVFRLRKEHKIEDALKIARECVKQNPYDDWNKKALGWVCYDFIKKYLDEHDYEKARAFMKEFDALKIPLDDNLMYNKINKLKPLLDPDNKILLKIREVKDSENHRDILNLYNKAIKNFSNNKEINEDLAWQLRGKVKELCKEESPKVETIRNYLAIYSKLNISKPSLVHSLILIDIINISEKYNKFKIYGIKLSFVLEF